jgi:hypothetical protein
LRVFPQRFAVCQLPKDAPADATGVAGAFVSITRTEDELSLVCEENRAPAGARVEGGWRLLRVAGTLDFTQVGVLAALCVPLAEAGISIFSVSTFDTDYLMLKEANLRAAIEALREAGHDFEVS